MPDRPAIPADVQRAIFVEAGHRCAVCGTPFPLERAHLIPWNKSKDHSAANLICLCANCHERADYDWDVQTLRQYKERPWVLRQHCPTTNGLVSAKTAVEVTIDVEFEHFDDTKKRWLQYALASFLETAPECVRVRSVEKGSVKVSIELPQDCVDRLLHAHETNDQFLRKILSPLNLRSVLPLAPVCELDPNWASKLGRVEQTGMARYLVDDMLRRGRPKGIALCWCGSEHSGVEAFHSRLQHELFQLANNQCLAIRVDWDAHLPILESGLRLVKSGDLGKTIADHCVDPQHRQLLYVDHTPIRSPMELHPDLILEYLIWWDRTLQLELRPQQHAVLGISFIVPNANRLRRFFDEAHVSAYPFESLLFSVLSPLERLKTEDLRDFIQRTNMALGTDPAESQRTIHRIMEATGGEYDLVVRELERRLVDAGGQSTDRNA